LLPENHLILQLYGGPVSLLLVGAKRAAGTATAAAKTAAQARAGPNLLAHFRLQRRYIQVCNIFSLLFKKISTCNQHKKAIPKWTFMFSCNNS
jgi:hypothetical protein